LLVGTANVLCTLDAADAGAALDDLLAHEPDLLGLQEWGPRRYPLLRRRGEVRLLPGRVPRGSRTASYTWLAAAVGGCAVGARSDRFRPTGAKVRLLSGPGRADPGSRELPVRPPRFAVVATYRDLVDGSTLAFVDYHLMPAVQARGRYRPDRPLLVGAHRQEARALDRIVAEHQALGHLVYAVGDSNFDGFRLAGLTSAWEGRGDGQGTFGRRRIDDVHGPARAESVSLLTNASDHKALLARFAGSQPTVDS
jgi:hypothetical protein